MRLTKVIIVLAYCLVASVTVSAGNFFSLPSRRVAAVNPRSLLKTATYSKDPADPVSISNALMTNRGGEVSPSSSGSTVTPAPADKPNYSLKRQVLRNLLGLWGVTQVFCSLANAVRRLVPVAIQPLQQNDLLPWQWGLYAAWSAYMMYAEGYKGFQKKFSPMVVQRAFSIIDKPSIFNVVLAGPYAMGMFGASRKRMIISWTITAGVFSLVKIVKLLPYPYRAIVDAGVVMGLSYGALSMVLFTVKALLGGTVESDDKEKDE